MPNFWDCKNTIFFIINAIGCFFFDFYFQRRKDKNILYYKLNSYIATDPNSEFENTIPLRYACGMENKGQRTNKIKKAKFKRL